METKSRSGGTGPNDGKSKIGLVFRRLAVVAVFLLLFPEICGFSIGQALAAIPVGRLTSTSSALTSTNAQAPTDTVPGSLGTTDAITVGGSIAGVIETDGDQDWYKVELTSGRTYRFNLNAESVSGQSALSNAVLTLYGRTGVRIASNDQSRDSNALFERQVSSAMGGSGTYFLAAQGAAGATGAFRLSVTDTTPVATPPTDAVPSNTGTTFSVTVGGSVTGTIDFSGDVDAYRVVLAAGRTYRFTLNGESVLGQSALPNAFLTLHGPTGTIVATDDQSGGNNNALLNMQISPATGGSGAYFLAAQGAGSVTGGFRLSVTDTTPPPPTDTVPEGIDTTFSIPVGETVTGTIDSSGDMDTYRIALTSGRTYRFTLNGEAVSGQSALPDALLGVYGPAGAIIGSDDQSGGNNNALINLPISSATGGSGNYFLTAQGAGGGTGGFRLSVSDATPAAALLPAAGTPTTLADCLFTWAESNYASFFAPRGARSATFGQYYYRYYAQTNSYLAVSSADNHLYYLGPQSRNTIQDAGAAATWYATAGCH